MLRLDSMSLFFQAFSESHLFCSIWCNRRLVLTYMCNCVQLHIFLPNTPTPPFSNGCHFSMDSARMLRFGSMSSFFQALSESHLFCSILCNRKLVSHQKQTNAKKEKKWLLEFFNVIYARNRAQAPGFGFIR